MKALFRFSTLALLVGAPGVGLAQTGEPSGFRKVGTTGMALLELPVSPRLGSLGDTRATDADTGADALFGNPAALGFGQRRHEASLGQTRWIADTQLQSAAYAVSLGRFGHVGLSVMRLDYGSIPGTTTAGAGRVGSFRETGDFTAEADAFGLSYARQLTDGFSFGATVRWAVERIADSRATALAADVGMLYRTGFRSLRIGGVMQNFGTESQYLNDKFKLPIAIRLGSAMELIGQSGAAGRVTASVEGIHPNNGVEQLHTALEWAPLTAVALRGGYRFGEDEGGLSLGIGLDLPGQHRLGLDAGYTGMGRLGHVFGLGLRGGW